MGKYSTTSRRAIKIRAKEHGPLKKANFQNGIGGRTCKGGIMLGTFCVQVQTPRTVVLLVQSLLVVRNIK